jgi:sRNA-binding protein
LLPSREGATGVQFAGDVAGILDEAVAEYDKRDYATAARLRRTLVGGQCFANVTHQPNANKRDQSSSNLSGFTGFSRSRGSLITVRQA